MLILEVLQYLHKGNNMNNWYLKDKELPLRLTNSLVICGFDISSLETELVREMFSYIDNSKNNFYIFEIEHPEKLLQLKELIESKNNIALTINIKTTAELVKIRQLKNVNSLRFIMIRPKEEIITYANSTDFIGVDYVSISTDAINLVKRVLFLCDKDGVEVSVFNTKNDKDTKIPSILKKYLA